MTRIIAFAFAALTLAAAGAPSATAETKTSLKVSYAGLNLASPADAWTMLNRLQKASRKACHTANLRTPEEQEWAQACMSETMARAVASLNAPMVTSLFMDPNRARMASR